MCLCVCEGTTLNIMSHFNNPYCCGKVITRETSCWHKPDVNQRAQNKKNHLRGNLTSAYCWIHFHFLSRRNLECVRVHHARLSQSIFMGEANFYTCHQSKCIGGWERRRRAKEMERNQKRGMDWRGWEREREKIHLNLCVCEESLMQMCTSPGTSK